MTAAPTPPVRREQKKSQRLAEITEVAARLMYTRGFANTAVADVTREVGIAPSALYRHFPSKEKLLQAVLDRRFSEYEAALDECADWDAMAYRLASVAVSQRDLGVLWQREARNIAAQDYEDLAGRLRMVAKRIAACLPAEIGGPMPISRAWATISILTSLSYHSTAMSQARSRRLIGSLIRGVGAELSTEVFQHDWATEKIAIAAPVPFDEYLDETDRAIIEAAARLYGTRGYHQVSMADLGEAVGMAGPSIYHRYESKGALLAAVLNRANDRLVAEARAVLASTTDPRIVLRDLLSSYARLVATEPHTVEALLSEVTNLAADQSAPATDLHQRYIKAWRKQLRLCVPELGPGETAVRVHAALTIVNDLSRTQSTRAELTIDDLCGLAWSALWAGLPSAEVFPSGTRADNN